MAVPFLAPIAAAATKSLLGLSGRQALRYAARHFLTGAAFGAGAEVGADAIQWLSDKIGAAWNSDEPGPAGDGWTGCALVEGGTMQSQYFNALDTVSPWKITRFGLIEVYEFYAEPYGEFRQTRLYMRARNAEGEVIDDRILGNDVFGGARTVLDTEGGQSPTCIEPAPTPPPPLPDPFIYTDPETSCKTVAVFQYWSVDEQGRPTPVYLYGPDNGSGGVAYDPADAADGCWYQPVIGGGDGEDPNGEPDNPVTIPSPGPGGDQPIYKDPSLDVAKEGAALALDAFWLTNGGSGGQYVLNPSCVSANPPEAAITVEIPSGSRLDSILDRSDALAVLDQGLKDLKQPICNDTPTLEGEFRTIGFISEEVSPNGKSCLRKRLRYRSKSGLGLDAVIDYWKDFQFNAGPVTVKHRGSSWGTITVWAASADEGKRVIRHAGGEAGIDADQTGRWEISGSSSSRLGMPGTMKVNQSGGYYWITARDGSNNRPLVGKT